MQKAVRDLPVTAVKQGFKYLTGKNCRYPPRVGRKGEFRKALLEKGEFRRRPTCDERGFTKLGV